MIARIRGKIVQRTKESVLVDVQNICYEVFLPRTVIERLENTVDEKEIELITYHYVHTDQSRGIPVIIGFLNAFEKDFFELFITVSGIGPKAALRALDKPISQIATAINDSDVQFLRSLPGIGPQRARQIIAQLQGKIARFGLINDAAEKTTDAGREIPHELREEVLEVLKKLQYRRPEALAMVEKALKENDQLRTVEEVLNEIYRQRRHGTI